MTSKTYLPSSEGSDLILSTIGECSNRAVSVISLVVKHVLPKHGSTVRFCHDVSPSLQQFLISMQINSIRGGGQLMKEK